MHDVLILGAGVVGVNTAYWFSRLGYKTLILDRQPGPAMETSFANGGQISVCHAEPWANPQAPFNVLKWLLDDNAPLLFKPRLDPHQLRWLCAWMMQCTPKHTLQNTKNIVELALYSREELKRLRDELNLNYQQKKAGILHFYRSEKIFRSAQKMADLMQEMGCDRAVVDKDAVVDIESALKPIASQIVGGTYTEDDESGDAHLYTEALAKICESQQGVEFLYDTKIEQLIENNNQVYVRFSHRGELSEITANTIVVCLGSWSATLLRNINLYLNIYPAKGYSITVPIHNTSKAPKVSLTDDQHKLVFSRLGDRLRIAGTAELSGYDDSVVQHRCETIVNKTRDIFPDMSDYQNVEFWAGLRPTTPSNVPYIGPTRFSNLWLNTGHGTLGWTMGCGSGKIVAQRVNEGVSEFDAKYQ